MAKVNDIPTQKKPLVIAPVVKPVLSATQTKAIVPAAVPSVAPVVQPPIVPMVTPTVTNTQLMSTAPYGGFIQPTDATKQRQVFSGPYGGLGPQRPGEVAAGAGVVRQETQEKKPAPGFDYQNYDRAAMQELTGGKGEQTAEQWKFQSPSDAWLENVRAHAGQGEYTFSGGLWKLFGNAGLGNYNPLTGGGGYSGGGGGGGGGGSYGGWGSSPGLVMWRIGF